MSSTLGFQPILKGTLVNSRQPIMWGSLSPKSLETVLELFLQVASLMQNICFTFGGQTV